MRKFSPYIELSKCLTSRIRLLLSILESSMVLASSEKHLRLADKLMLSMCFQIWYFVLVGCDWGWSNIRDEFDKFDKIKVFVDVWAAVWAAFFVDRSSVI